MYEEKKLHALRVKNVFNEMHPYKIYQLFRSLGYEIHEIRIKKIEGDSTQTKEIETDPLIVAKNELICEKNFNNKKSIIDLLIKREKTDSFATLKFDKNANSDFSLDKLLKNVSVLDKSSQIRTFLEKMREEYEKGKDGRIPTIPLTGYRSDRKKNCELVVLATNRALEECKNKKETIENFTFWVDFASTRNKEDYELNRTRKIAENYSAEDLASVELGYYLPNSKYVAYWDSNFLERLESNFVYGKSKGTISNKSFVIIDFVNYSSSLKIEFNFKHVKTIKVDKRANKVFIEMICPPRYYYSHYEESSYFAPKYNEKGWERIHNFGLDESTDFLLKNTLEQRLVLILTLKNDDKFAKLCKELRAAFNDSYTEQMNYSQIKMESIKPWLTYEILKKLDISFEMKYLILSCITQLKINIFEVDKAFIDTLQRKEPQIVEKTLEDIASKSRNVTLDDQDKMKENFLSYFKKIYEINEMTEGIWANHKLPDYMKKTRRVIITPTTIIYHAKEAELSNCILERHKDLADGYFLRATITDEMGEQTKNMTFISKKYFEPLVRELDILGRKFKFFAYSASQLRSGSFWMFSENNPENLSVRNLYKEIGNLEEIRVAAKYGARLGQLLSSSYSALSIDQSISVEHINDIMTEDRNFNFSDGVGKISLNLINKIKEKMKLTGIVSAIQIRCGGMKGILVGDPDIGDNKIQYRKSMCKFKESEFEKEVQLLDYSKFRYGYLNRQVITLLMSLGLAPQCLSELQEETCKLLSEKDTSDGNLFAYVNHLHNLSPTKDLLKSASEAGMNLLKEPFLKGIMDTIRIRSYINLKEKSNILVKESVRIMGVLDEYGILNEGEIYLAYSLSGGIEDDIQIVENKECVVTKNPCLHPGDIRVLFARSDDEVKRKFKHIVNCVVFPQKGKRPHTAEISGSDLDGDLYFVTWNQDLIPSRKNVAPCDYDTVKPENQPTPVVPEEIVSFFIKYINNDVLGKIDNTHLALADRLGADSRECLKLAEQHAIAVDFAKSGICPQVDNIKIKEYPDFMGRDEELSYESDSVLGKLYREAMRKIDIQAIDKNIQRDVVQIDTDMVHPDYKIFLKEAFKVLLSYYESVENILNMYNIESEFEIFSGNFSSLMSSDSKKKYNIEKLQDRMVGCLNDLKSRFEKIFMNEIEDYRRDQEINDENYDDDVYAKASAWYVASYFNTYCKIQDIKEYIEKNLKPEFEIIEKKMKKRQLVGLPWMIVSEILTAFKAKSKKKEHV